MDRIFLQNGGLVPIPSFIGVISGIFPWELLIILIWFLLLFRSKRGMIIWAIAVLAMVVIQYVLYTNIYTAPKPDNWMFGAYYNENLDMAFSTFAIWFLISVFAITWKIVELVKRRSARKRSGEL